MILCKEREIPNVGGDEWNLPCVKGHGRNDKANDMLQYANQKISSSVNNTILKVIKYFLIIL